MNYLLSLTLMLGYIVSFGQQEWELKKEQNNIKLWTKSLEGSKLLQFRTETYVKADLDAVYKILVNVENMHTWYEKVKKVVLLKKITDTEAVYLLEYGLPLPFENRISTLKGSISYDKTKGIIKVNSAFHPHNIPEKYQKYPLITQIKSSWDIESVKNSFVRIIHSGYMDPGGNIPLWLTNESVTSAPVKSITNLMKLLNR